MSLSEYFFNHVSGNVGQPKVTSLESVSEFFVVQAEQFQDGGVQIVDVDGIFGDTPADFISLADHLTSFNSSTSEPHTERIGMMIAAGNFLKVGSVFT